MRVGDRYRLPRDCFPSDEAYQRQAEWEVLSVSPSSLKVRRLASRYTRIETAAGEVAEFEAPDRAVHVARRLFVEVI